MITAKSETSEFTVGASVVGMVLRFDSHSASFVLQLQGNVPAVISAYEVPDEELDSLSPGSMFEAVVDRVERSAGHVSVVLRKHTQPIAV